MLLLVRSAFMNTLPATSQANGPVFVLTGKSRAELRAWMAELGEPVFRGDQIYHAFYQQRVRDIAEITNLPEALRARLSREASIEVPRIVRQYASADGTARYVMALAESKAAETPRLRPMERPATVEAVFMPSEGRDTICISTQAGCAVDCKFCLTATLGLIRNLTAGEILGQILIALEENRARLAPRTNLVLMGQGEPLLNYDAVMAAMRIALDPAGLGLSPRHVTLSTSGIIPGIERLGKEEVRPKLAISLNASNDAQRDAIMPINKKYRLEALLEACRNYPLRSWEKLTFEYVLLGKRNDDPENARQLARLLAGINAKVNLIPWNPAELPFERPEAPRVEEFRRILEEKGVRATLRNSRGQDVMAACGQLALIESAESLPSVPPS
jgi:23S rRNA (adenine2503-C2)-methyltransferase